MSQANDTPGSGAPPSPQASADPAGTTAVSPALEQTGPEKTIPLPPMPPPKAVQMTPEQLATEIGRLDWGLAAVALVLAFLLAS